MRRHPDFADAPLPRSARLPGFDLTPLTPAQVDEDFAAVVGSAHILKDVFGGTWPEGLTLQDNLYDLAWHDREFALDRSFAWIVRDHEGLYLGCAYLYPEMGRLGFALGCLWIVDRPDRFALQALLQSDLQDWFDEILSRKIEITWRMPPAV